MRIAAVVLASVLSTLAIASPAPKSFMPQNDLWQEDCLTCKSNSMTQELFQKIIDAGYEAYLPEARAKNERLVINARWTDSTVNANVCRACSPGNLVINLYGGLARRPEVLPASFALVLAHELGHAYGGAPYIHVPSQMSAEGQADYYATLEVFERIAERVPELRESFPASEFVDEVCETDECVQALEGSLGLGRLLANLSQEGEPRFETPDPRKVTRTTVSYPATVQCRVDSYLAGWFHAERPRCWFFK